MSIAHNKKKVRLKSRCRSEETLPMILSIHWKEMDAMTFKQDTNMRIDRAKAAMVTGANGYIASWLVKYLLEKGIHVHATVRNPDDPKKVGHLLRIAQKTPGELTLFRADLLE